jgi:hypothetical protein
VSRESNIDFCRRREAVERAAAEAAGDLKIREVHLDWADRYADRIWSLEKGYE